MKIALKVVLLGAPQKVGPWTNDKTPLRARWSAETHSQGCRLKNMDFPVKNEYEVFQTSCKTPPSCGHHRCCWAGDLERSRTRACASAFEQLDIRPSLLLCEWKSFECPFPLTTATQLSYDYR